MQQGWSSAAARLIPHVRSPFASPVDGGLPGKKCRCTLIADEHCAGNQRASEVSKPFSFPTFHPPHPSTAQAVQSSTVPRGACCAAAGCTRYCTATTYSAYFPSHMICRPRAPGVIAELGWAVAVAYCVFQVLISRGSGSEASAQSFRHCLFKRSPRIIDIHTVPSLDVHHTATSI